MRKLICVAAVISTLNFLNLAKADDLGCRSVYHACISIKQCLDTFGVDHNDTVRIKTGVQTGNGQLVADGGSACFNNWHNAAQWKRDTAGCLNPGYLEAGKRAVSGNCGSE